MKGDKSNTFRELALRNGLFNLDLDPEPAIVDRLVDVFDQLPDDILSKIVDALEAASDRSPRDPDEFVRRYHVTSAEKQLLLSLSRGISVSEHARLFSISVNTVRTHMRRLLEKTGSKSQIDLLRKFLV